MADLDAVVTGLGPGPFTGLRVGVVTAAALADARGLPVVGVCSLDAVGSGRAHGGHRRPAQGGLLGRLRRSRTARRRARASSVPEELGPARAVRRATRHSPSGWAPRWQPADVTTAGLLRAAAPQLADPSSAAPLVPLYLRRPDATPPTAIKAVSQA